MKKSQGKKLKTENSAKEAIRKKLRYSKKDNSLTIEEKNKIKKQTKRGRRIIKTEASAGRKVNSDICRHNEDDNVGTESLARGMECAEIALEKVKLAGYSKKIYKRAKKQSEKIETIKKNASNETSKAIQKNRMKRQMIDSYQKNKTKEAKDSIDVIRRKLIDNVSDSVGYMGSFISK